MIATEPLENFIQEHFFCFIMEEVMNCPEQWFSSMKWRKKNLPVLIAILLSVNVALFYYFPFDKGISGLPELLALLLTICTFLTVIFFLINRRTKQDTWTRHLEFNKKLFANLNKGIDEMLENLNYDHEVGPRLTVNDNEWSKLYTIHLPALPDLRISTVMSVLMSKHGATKISYAEISNILGENVHYARDMAHKINGILAHMECTGEKSDEPVEFLKEIYMNNSQKDV